MALYSLYCAEVPLRNCSLTHSLSLLSTLGIICCKAELVDVVVSSVRFSDHVERQQWRAAIWKCTYLSTACVFYSAMAKKCAWGGCGFMLAVYTAT